MYTQGFPNFYGFLAYQNILVKGIPSSSSPSYYKQVCRLWNWEKPLTKLSLDLFVKKVYKKPKWILKYNRDLVS